MTRNVTTTPLNPYPTAESLPAARALFGTRLGLAGRYAQLLATDGVVRGLIGPRETTRLWDRHLLNCAVLADFIPDGASVIDVGSGAGLPGIALAIARPDLRIVLVEPLARRTAFLTDVVPRLGLDDVTIFRGRAGEAVRALARADVVTARAVAPLDRLADWCLPLLVPGGRLLALKGATAAAEVDAHRDAVRRAGGGDPIIRTCGAGLLVPPATVVEITRRDGGPSGGRDSGRSRRSRIG